MHIILKSDTLGVSTTPSTCQNIYLFFFLDTANVSSMIKPALERNLANPHITKIFLFCHNNKHPFIKHTKIEYIETPSFYFSTLLHFVENQNLQGYILIATPHIFFNNTLSLLKNTTLHEKSCILNVNGSFIKNPRNIPPHPIWKKCMMCANVFIFHTNVNVPKERRKIFKINMSSMDSYSKILYLFYILNYELYNESKKIQCFALQREPYFDFSHYFKAILETRKQHKQDTQSPLILMEPSDTHVLTPTLLSTIQNGNRYDIRKDTDRLFNYVREKLEKREHFVIPRIAGIENQLVVAADHLSQNISLPQKNQIFQWFNRVIPIMKKNAGISITSIQSVIKYASQYAKIFEQCEVYTDWPSWGAVGKGIGNSQEYFEKKYKKPTLWAFVYDLYHTIYSRPWTHALRGNRILIISSFVESYKKKVSNGTLNKIYGIDLFPDCELLFLKPPQTQGSNPSEEFDVELERFAKKIEGIKDQFDVALCSCGGYGNLVCGKIFEMGKSAIYVGGRFTDVLWCIRTALAARETGCCTSIYE